MKHRSLKAAVLSRTIATLLAASLFLLLGLVRAPADAPAQTAATLTVQTDTPGPKISPDLYGIFFEEINRAGDGGLYAEMVQNRSFEDSDRPLGWSLVTGPGAQATMTLDHTRPLNPDNPTSLRLDITGTGGVRAGIVSQGFKGVAAPRKTYPEFLQDQAGPWLSRFEAATRSPDNGLVVRRGHRYNLSLDARCDPKFAGALTVSLEKQDGTTLASQRLTRPSPVWKPFRTTLTPTADETDARLVVAADRPGTVWLDMVSLFPADTFKGRASGLRPDLARMLAALHPAFVRFPGGSYAEGHIVADSYHWKQTVGDVAHRPGHWNIWGYRSSDGLGYHEYLQMCEDLGAKPLFVVNCGMAEADFVPTDHLGPWVQDALDAIEYANGPTTSKWGAMRARNGHPRPFGLRYVEIGNENGLNYPWGGGTPAQYLEHYRPFYDAIRAKYPSITLIADIDLPAPKNIVDEHYYDAAAWFAGQATHYDSYSRTGPKIYVGEYAVTKNAGGGNLGAALGEAAFMTGLERNGDVVAMASYAPLFVNPNWKRWGPDAIVFDSARAYGTPSYYVQMMFASARADVGLPLTLDAPAATPPTLFAVAGRKAAGDVILKIVNTAAMPCDLAIALRGAARLSPSGQATILSSADPQDENSFGAPTRVAPRSETFPIPAPTFHRVLAPYSVTILRLPARP